MKKSVLLLLGLLLASTGFAKEVTSDEASQAALRLVQAKVANITGVETVVPTYHNGEKAYYVVNFAPQGWALISADDKSTPLLGYSAEGKLDMLNVPENMQGWLNLYSEQISENAGLNIKRASGWNTGASIEPMATSGAIEALITVNWNQNGKYWKYCPSTASGTKAYVGCVAVSMAQAMSVAQYPPRPQGYNAYTSSSFGDLYCNYDNEPDYDWSNILSGANDYDDVARLLWHCGIAVNMNYGTDGSGAQNGSIASGLKKYFAYPSSVTSYARASYSDTDWKAMILEELTNGRAVCYAATDLTKGYGHAFNLDGYDGSGRFHVNWGWGGSYNGYFLIDNLQDHTMNMYYKDNHQMVVGIRAPSDDPSDITLSNTSVLEKQPVGTVVGAVTVVSEAANPTYTFEVKGKKGLFGYASCPFEVKDGKLVTTEVISASDYVDTVTETSSCVVNITATNTAGASVTRTFTITIKEATGIEEIKAADDSAVEYYNLQGVRVDNPEKGVFIKRVGGKTTKIIKN